MEGDAEEWVFKGEGNANIVFAYRGPDPDLVRAPLTLQGWRKVDQIGVVHEMQGER